MTRSPRALCVFAGPSLPPRDRIAAPRVRYAAPARRGDVTAAAAAGEAVLLIDGVFADDLAPSPREVALACDATTVFGAASMGALRACECRVFGMLPVGAIAGWYVAGCIDGDDEVAVAMHPGTYAALSVPAVNIRYVARQAARAGVLDRSEAAAWPVAARQIFYADRTWEDAIALAPPHARAPLASIAARDGDLKRNDARFALRRALRWIAASDP